jgi:hypothetical protein
VNRPTASPVRRLARVSYGATIGLGLGTVAGLSTGSALAPALGAALGAIGALVAGRLWERRR